MTAVEGQAAKDVAEKLGMSSPAVWMAKGRVISKIKFPIISASLAVDPNQSCCR
jgi:hypothetical protein